MREVDPSNLGGGAPARFNTCPPPPSFYTQQCSCDASLQTNHPPTPPPQRAEHKSCLGSGNHLGPSGCEQSKGRAGAYLGPSLRSCLLWGLHQRGLGRGRGPILIQLSHRDLLRRVLIPASGKYLHLSPLRTHPLSCQRKFQDFRLHHPNCFSAETSLPPRRPLA